MASNPVQAVGCFLQVLCSSAQLSEFVFPQRFQCSQEIGVKLYTAHDYTQEKLIRLLVSLAKGIPESFDILYCSTSTTLDDLELFMGRAKCQNLRRVFFVLGVNTLPYHIQEVSISQITSFACILFCT